AGWAELWKQGRRGVVLGGGSEAALGGALLPPFRNDARGKRPNPGGNVHHLAGRGHFKIKRPVDVRLEPRDVVIANVATVFPQMCRNAVGAGHNGDLGSLDRVRMPAAARIT